MDCGNRVDGGCKNAAIKKRSARQVLRQHAKSGMASTSLMALIALLGGCDVSGAAKPAIAKTKYVTQYGLGPDKWATAWLLTRRITPGAELIVVEAGSALPDGIEFDLPTSTIKRNASKSAFEIAKNQYGVDDPALGEFAKIIHEMEVNFWGASRTSQASAIENAFRGLQFRYGRDAVSAQCYLEFMETAYQALTKRGGGAAITADDLQVECRGLAPPQLAAKANIVREVQITDLLSALSRGSKVLFVDVREADEFAEAHIPNALNLQIRDVDANAVQALQDADYVVSYCVKDFRGFEMAKSLSKMGIKQSVILRPYGIKGWIAQGLPVAGSQALSEAQAVDALRSCVLKPQSCSVETQTTRI
jgi:rhodanese-related sulfurtransferase